MKLRAAVIGYGLAGRIIHAPLLRAAGFDVSAVVTTDPNRVASARRDCPGARLLASPEELWEDPSGHDLVVVATPSASHRGLAEAALLKGMHVVVDKPMASCASDAISLRNLAQDVGLSIHPFLNRRFDSDFLTLKNALVEGKFGRIHRFESRMEQLRFRRRNTWRDLPGPDSLGGVLYDFGPHLVDQALDILGPVDRVFCDSRATRFAGTADDETTCLLWHVGGAVSQLEMSRAATIYGPRFRIAAYGGGVEVDLYDSQEASLRDGMPPDGRAWGVPSTEATALLCAPTGPASANVVSMPYVRGCWDHIYPAIARSILFGERPPIPVDAAIHGLQVLDAARLSVSSRKVEPVGVA